ncbi:MAG: NAD(P)-dependent oxidoreductase [Candidatus Micrarchaeota archaeon]|nr:NAD(P)-dependent oxidoreductase [Candidatus Micrarchaeota archaeon]MDE1804439.1 NAD(P)-dependent oxidoreductase [Candidatus Micrarchaeota archaeon]MDE1847112.1 NAD(P)-dependent oxidoreductase [Candidatus Micrarchaeota archaeon]
MAKKVAQPVSDKRDVVSLVTGANGKMGRELVKMLIKKGDTVRAVVKRKEMVLQLPPGVIPYIGDVTDSRVMRDALRGVDNVYHLAAIVSEYKFGTQEIMRVNVEGTKNIMEACAANDVRHMIYVSSLDVYGHERHDVLTEDSKLEPKDRYGLSKVLAEQEVQKFTNIVPFTIFRPSQIYGPGFEHYFFKVFRAIKEGKMVIIGSGKNKLNLVHSQDVLDAFVLATSAPTSRYKIYNLTDGGSYTQEQLLNMAADMMKVPRPTRKISKLVVRIVAKQKNIDSDELRFLTSSRVVDISRIRRELGFEPKVSLQEGASEFVKEFLTQHDKAHMGIETLF